MGTQQIDQLLREGIQAAQGGNKNVARSRLREVVALDEKNEKGWLWLASVVDDADEQRVYLSNVLVINPRNQRAQQLIDALDRRNREAEKAPGEVAPGVNRRSLLFLGLIVGLVLILLIALAAILNNRGGSVDASTSAALAPTAETPVMALSSGTVVALAASPTATATHSAGTQPVIVVATIVRNTLPPTWTPLPPPTSIEPPTGTPLASPPPNLKGHLVTISGQQLTIDGFLPVIITNPDGSNPHTVPLDPERGEYAILMPDGLHIIYTYITKGTDSHLLRYVNVNGAAPNEVQNAWGAFPPLDNQRRASLSANGKLLAFAAHNLIQNEQYSAIYVLDLTRLTSGGDSDPAAGTPPSATATTKAPAKTAVPPTAVLNQNPETITPTPSLSDLYLMRVTAKNIGENDWPAISADGKTVAFVTDTTAVGKDGTDLYSAPIRRDSKPVNLTNDGSAITEAAPAWSPDGKQIAFMAASKDSPYNDIVLINADGGNRQTLVHLDKVNNIRPHWSPDGKYIAFSSDRTGKMAIYIMDVGSKTLYQVTHNPYVDIVTDWGQ